MIDKIFWALLFATSCAVYSLKTDFKTYKQDLGPLRLRAKTGKLPQKTYPLKWEEKQATRKAKDFVNFMKSREELNPLKIPKKLGPYPIESEEIDLIGNVTLENVCLTGIKDIVFPYLEVRLAPPRIDSNVKVVIFKIDSDFNLTAALDDIPFTSYGHVQLTLTDLKLIASFGPRTDSELFILDSADVTLDLKDVQLYLIINQFAEDLRTVLMNLFQDTEQTVVGNSVLKNILQVVNKELGQLSVKRIMFYLQETTESILHRRHLKSKIKSKIRRKYLHRKKK